MWWLIQLLKSEIIPWGVDGEQRKQNSKANIKHFVFSEFSEAANM